jgi:L-lactate dehydrogenase complex protein LldG
MTTPSSAGLTREAFLARISAALGRRTAAAPPEAPLVDESIARLTRRDADLAALFAENACATGMTVHPVGSVGVGDHLVSLASSLGLRTVAVGGSPVLASATRSLAAAGVTMVSPQGSSFEGLYEVDAGLTDVQAAIAETGSLVCTSGPDHRRGLSLVPPVHLAIVRRSDIVPDLIDYFAVLAEQGAGGGLPGNIVLITGPSKTADIEGVLVTGVHGPREVHILLIDDA